jgi:hypothetical protein
VDKFLTVLDVEGLKALDKITKPDPRFEHFHVLDEKTNQSRPLTLKDRFSAIEKIKLKKFVPEEIQIHFSTAKNLLLYSWFVYRFIPVAEMHAYSTVEMALKEITGKKGWGLKRLLKHAVVKGWIKDDGFRLHREAQERRKEYENMIREVVGEEYTVDEKTEQKKYVDILLETIPFFRNDYAHGNGTIHPGGYETLEICAEIINQLPWKAK